MKENWFRNTDRWTDGRTHPHMMTHLKNKPTKLQIIRHKNKRIKTETKINWYNNQQIQ